MTIFLTNRSDKTKKIYLEKGRVFEIASPNSSHYQSIMLTEGEGWIDVPPGRTIRKQVKGVCLNKNLKYPDLDSKIQVTPYVGDNELIQADGDQKKVHDITEFPKDNIAVITAKGYSNSNKDGKDKDREEAFQNAVGNAAKESGFRFSSETVLRNLKILQTRQKIDIEEKTIKLNRVIHEEYNDKTGEYLFIGEFEVRSKPSKPKLRF
ncbi:MAG: hypothetical protein GY863_12185 [bacterium]|nr:hypothetical protein [bacterium]